MTAAKTTSSKMTPSKKTQQTKRQKRKAGPNPTNTWQQQPKIKSMAAREKASISLAGLANANPSKNQKQSKKSSSPVVKEPLNPDLDIINSPEYKFGRLLASPNARIRHATIIKLREYLQARTDVTNESGGLSVLDLMKLWKGLWHTLYLCDGVAVQEEVSKLLASLIWSVGGTQEEDEYAGRFYLDMEEGGENHDRAEEDIDNDDDDEMEIIEMSDDDDDEEQADDQKADEKDADTEEEEVDMEEEEADNEPENPSQEEDTKHCRGAHLSALYVRTYFRTLSREWSNMDKYRIDKFYTLTRLILREAYTYMASRHWNLGIIRLFNDAIFEEVLRVNTYGNGVKFHLLDVCLEELAKVNAEEDAALPLTEATFLDCLEPFFAMAQRVEDKILHGRVMEKIMLRFLDEYSIVSDNYHDGKDGDDEEVDEATALKRKLVMDQVHVGTVAQFIFEMGSDSETQDRYRKDLYDMHKTFIKRVKKAGRDVNIDEEYEGDDEPASGDEEPDEPVAEKEEPETPVYDAKVEEENTPDQNESPSSTKQTEEDDAEETPASSKKSKKKKKKSKKKSDSKKKSKSKLEEPAKEEKEEVITISTKEQKEAGKAAAKAEKKKSSKKRKSALSKEEPEQNSDGDASAAKKVKFRKINMSKSFKASMKDLNKLDPKDTLQKTPEKSILLKKKKSGKKSRKS